MDDDRHIDNTSDKITQWKIQQNSLPCVIGKCKIFINNHHIYVLSSDDVVDTKPIILSASVNHDTGDIGKWNIEKNTLPVRLINADIVGNDNVLYTIGGWEVSTCNRSPIYQASINTDGSVDKWEKSWTMNKTITQFASVCHGDNAYMIGGYSDSRITSTVYLLPDMKNDGFIMSTKLGVLPVAMMNPTVTIVDDMLYVGGSYNILNGYGGTSNIFSSPIVDGIITTQWELCIPSCNDNIYNAQLINVGNKLYLFGNYSCFAGPTILYESTITKNKTLTDWKLITNQLMLPINGKIFVIKNNIYCIGGFNTNRLKVSRVYRVTL